jgi:hypothetical protein
MGDIDKPDHYLQGDIECIDALYSALGHEGFLSYCQGNVIKYLWRYKIKGGVDDLGKARVYLSYMIDKIANLDYGLPCDARR